MHKTDTYVRSGNGRGSVLGTSTGFASDVIKQISELVRYSQEHTRALLRLVMPMNLLCH